MDLPGRRVDLKEVETSVELVETSSGLCGFRIDEDFGEEEGDDSDRGT